MSSNNIPPQCFTPPPSSPKEWVCPPPPQRKRRYSFSLMEDIESNDQFRLSRSASSDSLSTQADRDSAPRIIRRARRSLKNHQATSQQQSSTTAASGSLSPFSITRVLPLFLDSPPFKAKTASDSTFSPPTAPKSLFSDVFPSSNDSSDNTSPLIPFRLTFPFGAPLAASANTPFSSTNIQEPVAELSKKLDKLDVTEGSKRKKMRPSLNVNTITANAEHEARESEAARRHKEKLQTDADLSNLFSSANFSLTQSPNTTALVFKLNPYQADDKL